MSYRVEGFASLDLLNRYFEEHLERRPMTVAAGQGANSLIVVFDVREERVAKEKNPKEPAEPDEDDEEEETEEQPEEPPQPVARAKRKPPPRLPRLPVHGAAKHKTVAKRKR